MKLLKAKKQRVKNPYSSKELALFKKAKRLGICEFWDGMFLTDGSLLIQDSLSNAKWVFDKLNRPIETFNYKPDIKQVTVIRNHLIDKTLNDTQAECVEYNNQIFAYDKKLVQILKKRSESLRLIQMNRIVCLAGYTTQKGLTVILFPITMNGCADYSVRLEDES